MIELPTMQHRRRKAWRDYSAENAARRREALYTSLSQWGGKNVYETRSTALEAKRDRALDGRLRRETHCDGLLDKAAALRYAEQSTLGGRK